MPMIPRGYNRRELERSRTLDIEVGKGDYSLPSTSIYLPLTGFIRRKAGAYPFRLLELLHVAGVKMLSGRILRRDLYNALFASGGLYYALDQAHKSLAFDRSFGDFTSGFSHQFGVALACMSLSEAYAVPWDQMVPIPVKGKKSLDYEVKCPDGMWLKLEAKGVSTTSRSQARASIGRKKLEMRKAKSVDLTNVAMVGVIAQTASTQAATGVIEFVDPEFEPNIEARREHNQRAGRLLHYATLAAFAGLNRESADIKSKAMRIVDPSQPLLDDQLFDFDRDSLTTATIDGVSYAGIQWRLDDDVGEEIWIYQGVDYKMLIDVLEDRLPDTMP